MDAAGATHGSRAGGQTRPAARRSGPPAPLGRWGVGDSAIIVATRPGGSRAGQDDAEEEGVVRLEALAEDRTRVGVTVEFEGDRGQGAPARADRAPARHTAHRHHLPERPGRLDWPALIAACAEGAPDR